MCDVCVWYDQEIHAACMIAYGIATSFQVLSNLSNTTVIATKDDVEEEDEHGTFRHRDDTRHSQSFASLFDGGRLPPAKLTVNYLMEVCTTTTDITNNNYYKSRLLSA